MTKNYRLLSEMFPDKEPLVRRIKRFLKNLPYEIRCYFKPFNVIKIQNLPRTWQDRDYVLFHAMFQIFVDYIELEKAYMSWDDKRYHTNDRHTDIESMKAWLEEWYGPNHVHEVDETYREREYLARKEILWIYEWYKSKEWDDSDKLWNTHEDEMAHIKKIDDMMHRLVAWRHYFWT